jgi:tetratricopeptide (TPR) repeat protein
VKATEAKGKLKAHLSQKEAGKWLLIFDNADSLDMWSRSTVVGSTPLTDYLAQHEQGHVLFTTRNRKAAVLLASANVIHVSEPDPQAAVRILEKSLIDKTLLNDGGEAVALELLEQLAFLPLAITQAAAYINENSIDFSDYIELLQDQESEVIELLSEDFGDDWRYSEIQNPVATTWLISFQQVQQLNQLAADYLLFMACINPRDIPKSLVPETVSKKKSTDAVGLLKAFSFINEQGGRLSLHRLVHLSTRNWLRTQSRFRQQLSTTTFRFDEVFPTHTYTNRTIWREYLPHALSLISEVGFLKEEYLSLLRRVGWCLNADRRFNEAALLFEDILEIQRSLHGETDIETTICAMGNLALVYCYQGRWTEAEKLQTLVLEIRKEELGPDHPMTLETMNNMALAYEGLGKYKEAEEIWAHLLETDKRMQGPEHQLTITACTT